MGAGGAKGGRYDDAKTYLLTGKMLNSILDEIRKNRPIAGVGTTIRETHDGRMVNAAGGATFPAHPWELYLYGAGWSVYPGAVNGDLPVTMDSVPLDSEIPPWLEPDGEGNLTAWLRFEIGATSRMGVGGKYYLDTGSAEITDVEVSDSAGSPAPLVCDPDTGVVSGGSYALEIGRIVAGVKKSQKMRFSIWISLCSDGGITIRAYG